MTFADIILALSKELGTEIEIEENTSAVRTGADGQKSVRQRGSLLLSYSGQRIYSAPVLFCFTA